jgi:hypothetical protein
MNAPILELMALNNVEDFGAKISLILNAITYAWAICE